MSARRILCLAAAFALMMAATGCIFSPDDEGGGGDPPPPPQLQFPDSPAKLMSNFQQTYEDRNFDWYVEMLHPNYKTVLQQETIDQFPDVGEFLELDEELHIHERMFSGNDLTDPNGEFVPGVAGIAFNRFEPMDAWRMSPADDPIPNAYFAPFDVDILFDRGQGHSFMSVKGQIRFYATSRDSLYEGEVRDYYQMAGQVDLTGVFKAVEESSWGSVKALYR